MSGLKEVDVAFQAAGVKVTPDEIDSFTQYQVINLARTDTWFGTVSSASAAAFVFDNVKADYPRNLLFTCLGVAGGMGGTAVVNGKDQFGNVISETMSFGSAAGGGTVAGTKIFASVTNGTMTPVGLGGTAVGTAKLGVAVGTAAGVAYKLGLPVKIGAVSDVRNITWSKENVTTAVSGGTIGTALVDVDAHSFKGTAVIGGTESYTVQIKSTYDNSGKPNLTR